MRDDLSGLSAGLVGSVGSVGGSGRLDGPAGHLCRSGPTGGRSGRVCQRVWSGLSCQSAGLVDWTGRRVISVARDRLVDGRAGSGLMAPWSGGAGAADPSITAAGCIKPV